MTLPGTMQVGTFHDAGQEGEEPSKEAGNWRDGEGLTITWSP